MRRHRRGSTTVVSGSSTPRSLADVSASITALADRSEEVSRRLRTASDFVAQVVDVQQGVERGARRIFRVRTLVIVLLVVVAAAVIRSAVTASRRDDAEEQPAAGR